METINRKEILWALGHTGLNKKAIREFEASGNTPGGFGIMFDTMKDIAVFFTALGIAGGYVSGYIDGDDARRLADAATFEMGSGGESFVYFPGIALSES